MATHLLYPNFVFTIMKKFAILFAASLYLLSITGVAVKLHFCGEELSAVIFSGADADCGCEVGCQEEGCCQDENFYFKMQTDHVVSASTLESPPHAVALLPTEPIYTFASIPSHYDIHFVNLHGPPIVSKYRTHLLIGRFSC